jgi:creatinine amidohydrolase/Fe(II)-dependent formamide hydrolase-like protein
MRCALMIAIAAVGFAETPVELELMTFPEVAAAIRQGKTTVLIYNGGTEQRGPHAVLGGHSLIARRTAPLIARRLGNALVAPVLPFSPADGHLKPEWPGTISLPVETYVAVNQAAVAGMVTAGFKNIVLMGDHGGGQKDLELLARRLDAKYAPKARVYFCGDLYAKSQKKFNDWLQANGYPVGTHASIPDTSELMYLGGDAYVRKDQLAGNDPPRGVQGDPRRSSPELGKRYIEMKVEIAAAQIRALVGAK